MILKSNLTTREELLSDPEYVRLLGEDINRDVADLIQDLDE